MYNYIGILNKSSSVNKSITCNFLNGPQGNPHLNLILSKGNVIEIYNITEEGLESTPYLNVYGKIILLEKIPAGNGNNSENNLSFLNSNSDNLFILTEDLDFCIISHNKNKNEIVNQDKGSIKEDIGKRQDRVHSVFNFNFDFAVLSAYKNVFKIVFLKNRNKFSDFSVRYEYEELLFFFSYYDEVLRSDVNSMNSNRNTQHLGVIKVSSNYALANNSESKRVNLETFTLNTLKQEISKEKICSLDITSNPTCSLIVSPKLGGLLIFYSNHVKYYSCVSSKFQEIDTKNYSDRKFVTHCEIDKFRYLVLDENGNLFLIAFKNANSNSENNIRRGDNFISLIFQFLGEINCASTMTYLDNNYLFSGSEKANSQLIKITKLPTSNSIRPFLEIIEEYECLAPICDFTIMNNPNEESRAEILCVSGAQKSCSLKTIRKGTSINIEGEIQFSHVKNLFSVEFRDPSSNSMIIDENPQKSFLIFANFIDKTELITFDPQAYLIKIGNYESIFKSEITLYAHNLHLNGHEYIMQITPSFIIIYDENIKFMLKIPTIIEPILIKYKRKSRYLYIYNKNNFLIRYNFEKIMKNKNAYDENSKFYEESFTPEILCDDVMISSFAVSEDFIIFSQWNISKILIYSLKTKKIEILCEYEENLSCASISLLKSDGIKFLFIVLSDGKMLFYKLKTKILGTYTFTSEDFILKRKYNISYEIFETKKIKFNNRSCLFLNTDLPGLLYINKEVPNISNFNVKDCKGLVSLSGNSFAFLFQESIFIGGLSNSQSQNITTKYINKQIYNLTNVTVNKNNNLIAYMLEDKKEDLAVFSFVLIDKHLNELSRYTLDTPNEVCTTFTELEKFESEGKKLFALGTGKVENISNEPEIGNIYLLQLNENLKFNKVGEIETKGGVYKINSQNGLIFVGICSILYVYSVNIIKKINNSSQEYELKLIRKNTDFTIINDIICHDGLVIVSDVYKSITIFKFDDEKEKLVEICRDFNPIWCYSLSGIEKNIYLVTDIDGNIFTLRRELQPRSDDEKYKLERISQFNLGERINKLVTVQKLINTKDWESIFLTEKNSVKVHNNYLPPVNNINLTYFGTLEGSLGIIANIPKETFDYLYAIQKAILKVTYSTGNFEYDKWRAFKDGFISDFSKGFVDGNILQEFLHFDHHFRIEFLKNMKYPWQRNINDTIHLIEALVKLH